MATLAEIMRRALEQAQAQGVTIQEEENTSGFLGGLKNIPRALLEVPKTLYEGITTGPAKLIQKGVSEIGGALTPTPSEVDVTPPPPLPPGTPAPPSITNPDLTTVGGIDEQIKRIQDEMSNILSQPNNFSDGVLYGDAARRYGALQNQLAPLQEQKAKLIGQTEEEARKTRSEEFSKAFETRRGTTRGTLEAGLKDYGTKFFEQEIQPKVLEKLQKMGIADGGAFGATSAVESGKIARDLQNRLLDYDLQTSVLGEQFRREDFLGDAALREKTLDRAFNIGMAGIAQQQAYNLEQQRNILSREIADASGGSDFLDYLSAGTSLLGAGANVYSAIKSPKLTADLLKRFA